MSGGGENPNMGKVWLLPSETRVCRFGCENYDKSEEILIDDNPELSVRIVLFKDHCLIEKLNPTYYKKQMAICR
jgi:hypothetical protein